MISSQEVERFRKKYNITPATVELQKAPSYLARVGSSIKSEVIGAGKAVQRGAELMQQGKPIQGAARAGLGSVGGAIRTAFTPISEAIAPGVQKGINVVSDNPLIQAFASNPRVSSFLDTVFGGVQQAEQWATQHPDAAANLKDTFDIATAIVGTQSAKPVGQGAASAVKTSAKTVAKVPGVVARKAEGVLGDQPAKIMQRVARISKGKQAKFEKVAGESVGEYLTQRGIFGDIDDISSQLYTKFSQSKQSADDALSQLTGTYEPPAIKTALKELGARETRVSAEGAPSPNLSRVVELTGKVNTKGLNMSEINEIKRLYERSVKLDFLKQNLPEGIARANNIDNAIRNWQFKQAETLGLKNLPEINKETRLAKQLLDDIGAEYAGAAGNNAITLTDWILLSGGDPTAIAGFLTKKTFSSKKVQSAIAKVLNQGKSVKGAVKPDIGQSKVPQLQAGKKGGTPEVNVPMKMPAPYSAEKGVSRDIKKKIDNSLFAEARKYKSAEEFVKAQGKTTDEVVNLGNDVPKKYSDALFRREKVDLNELSQSDHFDKGEYKQPYFKEMMSDVKNGKELPPIIVDKNGSVIDGNHRLESYLKSGNDFQYIYREIPQTKSQLTDIYNQAKSSAKKSKR